LVSDACPLSSDCGSEVADLLEDSSRLSAWLNRLGLSSRLTDYTSLLRSVNPLSSCGSETAFPSSTSVDSVSVAGESFVVASAAQEFPTCRSFVPRVLPHVGLNSVLSMKRNTPRSRHSVTHGRLPNSSLGSKESVEVSPSGMQFTGRHSADSEEKSSSLTSTASSSPGLSTPVLFGGPVQDPNSECVPTLVAATETSSGHFLSAVSMGSSPELLKSAAVPSFVMTPDVTSVFRPVSASAGETDFGFCDNVVSSVGFVSASSPTGGVFGEGRKTSTPAKRPQSLDVIPWSPLSRPACTLTGSLSTVVHSQVSIGSISTASEPIPASPVDTPAV